MPETPPGGEGLLATRTGSGRARVGAQGTGGSGLPEVPRAAAGHQQQRTEVAVDVPEAAGFPPVTAEVRR
ncbi:hypothetical protein [Micromonospora pisi]|uniref:hypothetical protein n=1 Tax=Micromonospora pisi TaxID=589240 RepID=UPI0011C4A8BC|nr:hypothetical protein [Micromonospora pisi]